ncbi:UPF0160 protein [Nosema bombycis CQ1]|uniref:UPF0160 protein n=1 Tax=Nosema bombycis (strain CQ1 / CVCC 102059) TaxID=578461 RepID=R0KQU6_NOSB1|nr:UPF0160 protein [Nosema bombycis CQ1]|eukprot:EOB12587.1 UPF0160 protein [Nosema bombycis CQ1]
MSLHSSPKMKLITHDERFHFDEVLSTAILKRIYPNATVIRTRDNEIIKTGDIVYDVGGIIDPSLGRFDHHMNFFTETYSDKYKIKLSSSGLVFKYFTEELMESFNVKKVDDDLYDWLISKVYERYFLPADAVDNGVDIYGEIKPYTIYDLVENLNNHEDLVCEKQTEQFYKAVEIVSLDFENFMTKLLNCWYYKFIEIEKLLSNHDDYILVSDTYIYPNLILDVERRLNKNILFLVFPSMGKYKIRAINEDKKTFKSKLPLKAEWRGKREEELKDLIEGGFFVHSSGFIGVNRTLEGAIKMCRETFNEKQ